MTHAAFLKAINRRHISKAELQVLWDNFIWPRVSEQKIFYAVRNRKHLTSVVELYDVSEEEKDVLRWRRTPISYPYMKFLRTPYKELPLLINEAANCTDPLWKRIYMLRISNPNARFYQPKLVKAVMAYESVYRYVVLRKDVKSASS